MITVLCLPVLCYAWDVFLQGGMEEGEVEKFLLISAEQGDGQCNVIKCHPQDCSKMHNIYVDM